MPDNDILRRLPPADDRAWILSILKERDRGILARSILDEVMEILTPGLQGDSRLSIKIFTDPDDGETRIEYSGRYIHGGHFRLVFKPINAVEEIVTNCKRIFYKRSGTVSKIMKRRPRIRPPKLDPETQVYRIREMAYAATVTLITGVSRHHGWGMRDGYEESLLVAEAMLAWRLSGGKYPPKHPVADLRDEVERLSQETWRRRKRELNQTMRLLPGTIVAREKSGRPANSKTDPIKVKLKQRLRETKVVEALLELQKEEKQSMKAVADKLEVNAKTISNWAKKYGWDWEDLKMRALEKRKT